MYVVSFDPGGTTGVAVFDSEEFTISLDAFNSWHQVDAFIRPECEVVIERPFLPIGQNIDIRVFEVSGAIQERAHTKQCNLTFQMPAVKDFIPTRYEDFIPHRLFRGRVIHSREAAYHLFHFLIKRYQFSINMCTNAVVRK